MASEEHYRKSKRINQDIEALVSSHSGYGHTVMVQFEIGDGPSMFQTTMEPTDAREFALSIIDACNALPKR